jgi:hypothetical protein
VSCHYFFLLAPVLGDLTKLLVHICRIVPRRFKNASVICVFPGHDALVRLWFDQHVLCVVAVNLQMSNDHVPLLNFLHRSVSVLS